MFRFLKKDYLCQKACLEVMDKLIFLYEQLKKIRESGVRVKDISEETDIASSVLSSLYSSVLPAYVAMVADGEDSDEALDKALQLVNNVSKRKLMGCLDDLLEKIAYLKPKGIIQKGQESSVIHDLEKEAAQYVHHAGAYTGLYIAYSRSSFSDGLKVEPYQIAALTEGELSPRVYCQNMHGEYYVGTGIFSPFQTGYLLFNEQKRLQVTFKVVYLQLPVLEHPALIKGIYMTHDYNRNPIARRVVLVRQGDEISLDEFAQLKTYVIPKEEIPTELQPFYDYTCRENDFIKSIMLVSPQKNIEELSEEKKMLDLLSSSSKD